MTRILIVLLCASSAAFAQAFEVVAIKPAPVRTREQQAVTIPRYGPLYFFWPQISIQALIMFAYDLESDRVVVSDASIRNTFFDITAKAPEPVTLDQARPMIRTLLEERFGLVMHREIRTFPTYELTVAKSGLKMLDSSLGNPDDPRASPLPEQKEGGTLWIEPGKEQFKSYTRTEDVVTLMAGRQTSISSIGRLLNGRLRAFDPKRLVVDKTGLTGTYDFGIQFLDPSGEVRNPAKASTDVPGIFYAVEQYLGLHIEAKNGPVEVLVVDSANLDPGEN